MHESCAYQFRFLLSKARCKTRISEFFRRIRCKREDIEGIQRQVRNEEVRISILWLENSRNSGEDGGPEGTRTVDCLIFVVVLDFWFC